jgi:hypothetical protein
VPAVESGVLLVPPALRGWCLVQPPRWGVSRAGSAVWGSQVGKIWATLGFGLWAGVGRFGKLLFRLSALGNFVSGSLGLWPLIAPLISDC